MLIDDSWSFAFALVGAIGSVATAIAVIFLWIQSRQTQKQIQLTQEQTLQTQKQTRLTEEQTRLTREEMESTLRPWLAVSDITKNERWHVRVDVKNTGSIPAKIVDAQEFYSSTMITPEQLRSGEDIHHGKVVIFPNTEKIIRLSEVISGAKPYVGLLVKYEYSKNKHGEFGLIAKYSSEKDTFRAIEEFAN